MPQAELGQGLDAQEEFFLAQVQLAWCQGRAFRVVAQQAPALVGVEPELVHGAGHVAQQHDAGMGAGVVQQRGGLLEKQGQVILDAGARHAVGHVAVQRAAAGVALDALAPLGAEPLARGLVEREFAARQHAHGLHRIQAALGVGVEGVDGLHGVAEQVHPQG
ncbi:hypothetical protein GALL_259780 [mine drainage metagenome]|uniref:Uncharacterized protein n=1 Tax=mine drainage metagenome TaxID=410659 RepID=A0A1J5RVM6_9ZZZZ